MRHGSIMHRSFAEHMGFNWPPELHSIVNGKQVTWAEVHAARKEKQAERLRRVRACAVDPIVPCYVWTFLVPGWLYSGWWCYIVTRHDQISVNFRRRDPGLKIMLMKAIPMGILPGSENFTEWMAELARRFPRRRATDKRKAGSVIGWYDRDNNVFAEKKHD